VAYSSLAPEDRRTLHAGVVSTIEAQQPDQLAEQVERLAHHAWHGGLWQKAAGYLQQMGRKATTRGASHEAVAALEQALEALGHLPGAARSTTGIDLRLDLYHPLMALSAYGRALDHLGEAATLAEALGERKRLARARAGQCLILRATGSVDEAIEAGRQARAILVELGEANLVHDMNYLLASAFQMKGELREAEACYRESFSPLDGELTRERALALPRYAAAGRAFLAWALEQLGKFGEGLAAAQEALEIAELRGEPIAQVMSRSMLAKVQLGRGDVAAAIRQQGEALALCRAHDVRTWLSPVTTSLGFACLQAGRVPEAIALLEEGVAHAGATGQMTDYPARIARLAQTYLAAGRRAEAAETVQRGTALARKHGLRADEAECLRVTGLIAAAAEPPDVAAAEAWATRARALAAALGMRPLVAHCHLDLGRLFLNAGKADRAREHLGAASAIYEELDMPAWLDVARAEARNTA
jgi:tetratricopeptide (TPR) repeat protein